MYEDFNSYWCSTKFIKAAAFSKSLQKEKNIVEVIIHTGQHYDNNMSQVFFQELELSFPKYNLGIGNCSHGEMIGQQIIELEKIFLIENPDFVLLYGDTNSTLSGAIIASKLNIPIIHVEAGLRSYNNKMPEEINRILTDHTSNILFAPTQTAENNLISEGVSKDKIHYVGDIMFDAKKIFSNRSRQPKDFNYSFKNNFYLLTIHRQENISDIKRLNIIFDSLRDSQKDFIMPLHPNTRKIIKNHDLVLPSNINIIDPVSYLEMLWLLENCQKVVTDSGGLQKEAYFHNKYCITLREETEWTETVTAGVNVIVGVNKKLILKELNREITETNLFNGTLYGDGDSSKLMISVIKEYFKI